MPRVPSISTNFTSGEWTERLDGRVDLAKYQNACSCLHNYLVFPQGGATRRPGTRFIAAVKTASAGPVKLMSFIVSPAVAYVLELGATYIRFYRNEARVESSGTPVEVTSPYAIADVFTLRKVPSIDVLYLLHGNYQTRKLERYSDTVWKLRTVPFEPPPSIEFGARPIGDLVPSALSGDGVAVESSSGDSFYASDVGREILVTHGENAGARAGIASVTGVRDAVVNICVPFTSLTATCSLLWKITGSPLTGITPSAHHPVGSSVTLTLAAAGWRGTDRGLADSDCGKFAKVNGGVFRITSLNSTTVANAIIEGRATPDTAAQAKSGAWTLDEALFSTCNGWAEVGTFHDQRLYLAAKHRFAGSKSADFENFGEGTLDDDAVLFALDSDELETIRWVSGGGRGLLLGTTSGEWEALGSTDSPITATNIQVKEQTYQGSCDRAAPVKVDNSIFFVTGSGRQVRSLSFSFDIDRYTAQDLLLLAEHLTRRETPTGTDPTIIDMAWQREPDARLWCVRSDGVLLCLTFLREHEVVAWSRCTTQGYFESVATIPHPQGGRDQVWVSVRRTVNNATVRYVEILDDTGINYPTLNVDCAYVCTAATATRTFSGLGHLECATVQVVADGSVRPNVTVVGGNITIASPCATKVEVGLGYTSDLTTMRPESTAAGGTAQLSKRRWARLAVRLVDTLGMRLGTESGEELVPFRSASDCMGFAPALFTGDKEISHLGWDDGKVSIRQVQPLPSTVLAIMGVLDLGGA